MHEEVVEFELYTDLAEVIGDRLITTLGIGPLGDVIMLLVDPQQLTGGILEFREPGRYFISKQPPHGYDATVLRYLDTGITPIELTSLDSSFLKIQPLPDGGVLLAPAIPPRGIPSLGNSIQFDSSGQIIRRLYIGIRIRDMQVDLAQRIWVSFFDEGIFSGDPISCFGLVCFSLEGDMLWHYSPPDGFGPYDDSEALNVTSDDVWLYYSSSYPIMRIGRQYYPQGWHNTFHYADAMAVAYPHVLLLGGQKEDQNRCILQTIDGDRLVNPRRLDLRLPGGVRVNPSWVTGRDAVLHAIVGTRWYRFDLRRYLGGLH